MSAVFAVNRIAYTEAGRQIQDIFRSNRKLPLSEGVMRKVANADVNTNFSLQLVFNNHADMATFSGLLPKRSIHHSFTSIQSSDPENPQNILTVQIPYCTVGKLLTILKNKQARDLIRGSEVTADNMSFERAALPPRDVK